MNYFDDDDESMDKVDNLDAVEADISIAADLESVWKAVSEPGWWVNDGPFGDNEFERGEDGLYRIEDPDAGAWLIEKEDEDPMDLISFRWYPLAGDEFPEERTTRVEVSLSEKDGQVQVHVEESDITSVSDDEAEVRQAWEDAQGTWDVVLPALKAYLEGAA